MEDKTPIEREYTSVPDVNLDLHTVVGQPKNNCLLGGKSLYCPEAKRFTFVQNLPRGPRSIEVARGVHCRIVRRPDGKFTATFRFDIEEKYIGSTLTAELRNILIKAQDYHLKMKAVEKNQPTTETSTNN